MKTMIYTAVGLITCASVFGLSDYLNAKKGGTLVNYTEEPVTAVTTESKSGDEIHAGDNEIKSKDVPDIKEIISSKKITKANPKFVQKYTVTKNKMMLPKEPIPDVEVELLPDIKVETIEVDSKTDADKKVDSDIEKALIPEANTKRKLNLEMFSRKMPSKEFKKKK